MTAARPDRAQDVAPRPAPRQVCLLVFNYFTHDSRVLNVAQTFAADGDDVLVVAVAAETEPADEARAGMRIARLPFDPIYYRLWQGRFEFTRPWRHVPELRARLAAEREAISKRPWRAARTLPALLLIAPWIALTTAYHFTAKIVLRLLRRAGVRPPWSPSRWLDQRYRGLLFAAPGVVRVATWSRAVLGAFRRGSLTPARIWHANDLETLPVALLLRRRHGGRVVYDSHEIYLELPGPSRMGRLRRWLLRRAEGVMARSADAVVTINEPIAEELRRRYRLAPPLVVRSCPPLWSPGPAFRSPLRAAVSDLGVPDLRRLVLFHGNLQPGRGIEQLLEAAQAMTDVAVVLLGDGPLGASMGETSRRPEWRGRLALLPVVPPDELLDWLAGADVSACLIQPVGLNHRLSSPNKLFQAIAAGVPLLATRFGPIGDIVERYRVGITCDPRDVADVAAGLRRLLDLSPSETATLRENARRAHRAELNWEHEAAGLQALYERLAPRSTTAAPSSASEGAT